MKRVFQLILLLLLFGQAFAQIKPNLSNFQFSQKKNQIENSNSDIQKLNKAKNTLQNYALTCLQIKTVAELFGDDYARYDFLKFIYGNITDTQNFYEVYDTFIYFSTVLMLHDYIEDLQENNTSITPPKTLNFPLLNYPNASSYTGNQNGSFPLSNQDFHLFALDLLEKSTENDRNNRLAQIAQNHCLTTAQAMKLATMLEVEANKLTFLKQAYLRSFDSENFKKATQVFAYSSNKNALSNYIDLQVNASEPVKEEPCETSESDFLAVKQSIEKEAMDSKKVKLAKYLIKTKKCFTSAQIKEIAELIRLDSYTTDLAKFAYDYTSDTQNYHLVINTIRKGSYKEQVINYIENKK